VKIYSYWVFVMTAPFSPLTSAIAAFIGSALMHLIPLWILRKTPLDVVPNALLMLNGTNYMEVYSQ